MSDENMRSSNRGRWDHLLREIPTRQIKETPAKKESFQTPLPLVPEEPRQEEDKIFKVSQINGAIKKQLEGQFAHLWLQGEISNFKAHSSGHFYFSLKDEKSQISAVMFRGFNGRLKFQPESGMEVLVRGKISVYEPRGNYQIFCEHMEPIGAGALQKAFEQLKLKLQKEGLFDESRKKALPDFPKNIGVVTSPTGAAIQDILNVLGRRSKRAQVTVVPARVQGEGAAAEIVKAIELANQVPAFDVLIVGRGGGSIEDLWCFNEEIVARAIANSKLPIISAVGHEIDFTISDFVSDKRAPTPSAAAEIVAQSEAELAEKLKFYSKSIRFLMFQKMNELKEKSKSFSGRLVSPKKWVEDAGLRLEDFRERLELSLKKSLQNRRLRVEAHHKALKNPMDWVRSSQQKVSSLKKILWVSVKSYLQKNTDQVRAMGSLLDSLSPLRTVDRGYALVRQEEHLISDVSSLQTDKIDIQLRDGSIEAKVLKTHQKEKL